MATAEMRKQFGAARTEFKEMSIQELKSYEELFTKYDTTKDGFIDMMELKYMMEKMGAPQTHLGLKEMIKVIDEDFDEKISYREFLLIFRYAQTGQLVNEGLKAIAKSTINVSETGTKGAAQLFEAKAKAAND